MPIRIDTLRHASGRYATTKSMTLNEARDRGIKTVFLCHSHLDEELVKGVIVLLKESGWKVYVDWADVQMPEQPNRDTARRIQNKIVEHDYFLFLATRNSLASRWCPWEIGFADGKKPIDRILILATADGNGEYGNEYLQLYSRVDLLSGGTLGLFQPGQNTGLSLRNL